MDQREELMQREREEGVLAGLEIAAKLVCKLCAKDQRPTDRSPCLLANPWYHIFGERWCKAGLIHNEIKRLKR